MEVLDLACGHGESRIAWRARARETGLDDDERSSSSGAPRTAEAARREVDNVEGDIAS
jgi:SAM-dependent methyltransferase